MESITNIASPTHSLSEQQKEQNFLDFIKKHPYYQNDLLTWDWSLNYRKIVDNIDSSFNYVIWDRYRKNINITDYLLWTNLSFFPEKLLFELDSRIVKSPDCPAAIEYFVESIKNKKWVIRVSQNQRFYQKEWNQTLISSQGKFLLPNQLIKIINQKIFNENNISWTFENMTKECLETVNDYLYPFGSMELISDILVIKINNEILFNNIINQNYIDIHPWALQEQWFRAKILSHIISHYLPEDIKNLLKETKPPQLENNYKKILVDILSQKDEIQWSKVRLKLFGL